MCEHAAVKMVSIKGMWSLPAAARQGRRLVPGPELCEGDEGAGRAECEGHGGGREEGERGDGERAEGGGGRGAGQGDHTHPFDAAVKAAGASRGCFVAHFFAAARVGWGGRIWEEVSEQLLSPCLSLLYFL